MDIEMQAAWNMVSVPLTLDPDHHTPADVFPNAVAVHTWNPGSKCYEVPDDILPEVGYWVAVTEDKTITVTGTPVESWTGHQLLTGWNMVGSVAGEAVPVGSLGVDPPGSVLTAAIYWWDPESKSYTTSSIIEEGKGYWAAATQGGELTMVQP